MSNQTICTDLDILDNSGSIYTLSDNLIGKGSFGGVYLATDETGKKVAVKCCKIEKDGIPNILESSIMTSYKHPHLNTAIRIKASDRKLYIIQELAITDLAQYTRKNKNNHRPDILQLKNWCYGIAQAVAMLHQENIIHCDIKASNVLLFPQDLVRLTDFTLALKKWSVTDKFNHNVCTCTHRPLECLLNKEWNESLDIWALGCTFYEIAYGELLFPFQGIFETGKIKNNDQKIRLRLRSINAIIQWSAITGENIPLNINNINYAPPTLPVGFHNIIMKDFNDLLMNMLKITVKDRYNIEQVLNHPFFTNMYSCKYTIFKRLSRVITDQQNLILFLNRYTFDKDVIKIAIDLYSKYVDHDNLSSDIILTGCLWLGSKLVWNKPIKLNINKGILIETERIICHNLQFRLHC